VKERKNNILDWLGRESRTGRRRKDNKKNYFKRRKKKKQGRKESETKDALHWGPTFLKVAHKKSSTTY